MAGVRTPFAKSGTVLRDVSAVALARHAARELLYRTELDGREVDEVIWGQVVPSVLAPNVGREVSLLPQFPRGVPAYTLNRACASGGQAVTNAADQIVLGHADVILAGGVETLSDIPILHSRRMSQILVDASKAKTFGEPGRRFRADPPRRPGAGDARHRRALAPARRWASRAEKMAKENGITREEQDELALMSHQRAPRPARRTAGSAAEIAPWFGGAAMDRAGDERQRHPGRHLARGARRAQAGVRPAATARSPRATRRRSPTAPRRCC